MPLGNGTPRSNQPELYNFLGARHSDGTQVALSHAYSNVAVVFADLVGIYLNTLGYFVIFIMYC